MKKDEENDKRNDSIQQQLFITRLIEGGYNVLSDRRTKILETINDKFISTINDLKPDRHQ